MCKYVPLNFTAVLAFIRGNGRVFLIFFFIFFFINFVRRRTNIG